MHTTNKQKPLAPLMVLGIAILLLVMGQVLNYTTQSDFFLVCFMVFLGLITFNLAQAIRENIASI